MVSDMWAMSSAGFSLVRSSVELLNVPHDTSLRKLNLGFTFHPKMSTFCNGLSGLFNMGFWCDYWGIWTDSWGFWRDYINRAFGWKITDFCNIKLFSFDSNVWYWNLILLKCFIFQLYCTVDLKIYICFTWFIIFNVRLSFFLPLRDIRWYSISQCNIIVIYIWILKLLNCIGCEM